MARIATDPLVAAQGRLVGNDWGVPDSFEWELTFSSDRPARRADLLRAVRRACAFEPAEVLTSQRVNAHLVIHGLSSFVPTEFSTDCTDRSDRLGTWVEHLEQHPLAPEVRGIHIFVMNGAVDAVDDGAVTAFVAPADASPAMVEHITRGVCARPGPVDLLVQIRSSARPWAVEDRALASDPVSTRSC